MKTKATSFHNGWHDMMKYEDVYWDVIGIRPKNSDTQDETVGEGQHTKKWACVRKAALNRAHEIRKFEIELYWKRAAHFWVLQAAVFAAIAVIWGKVSDGLSPLIPLALASLGTVTACAGYLSARGSKFWQENWEYHIDKLEDEFEGRLHKTAYVGKDGLAWSVTRINSGLAVCFLIFWVAVFCASTWRAVKDDLKVIIPESVLRFLVENIPNAGASISAVAVILLATLISCVYFWKKRTGFESSRGVSFIEEVPKHQDRNSIAVEELPRVEELAKRNRPFLIRREPRE